MTFVARLWSDIIFPTGWVSAIYWSTVHYKTVCLVWSILFCNLLMCSVLHGPTFLVDIGHRMQCLSVISLSWLIVCLVCMLWWSGRFFVWWAVFLTGWVLAIYWSTAYYKSVCFIWDILFCNLLTDSVLCGPTCFVAIGPKIIFTGNQTRDTRTISAEFQSWRRRNKIHITVARHKSGSGLKMQSEGYAISLTVIMLSDTP